MVPPITRLAVAGIVAGILPGAATASPASSETARARQLYDRGEFAAALDEILGGVREPDGSVFLLMGQCHYFAGNTKAASVSLEKAAAADARNPVFHLCLGRAYGRRAETAGMLAAPGLAVKARRNFEAAVRLNPSYLEAIGEIFEYYLDAPGLLGGGVDKAAELASRARFLDPAEYQWQLARLDEKRKQYRAAEGHYRRAAALVPGDPGRLVDLARFLEARGRHEERDEVFRRADELAPDAPLVWFEQVFAPAETTILKLVESSGLSAAVSGIVMLRAALKFSSLCENWRSAADLPFARTVLSSKGSRDAVCCLPRTLCVRRRAALHLPHRRSGTSTVTFCPQCALAAQVRRP
jgi:tetratricopeptide (TPR) repeat protein